MLNNCGVTHTAGEYGHGVASLLKLGSVKASDYARAIEEDLHATSRWLCVIPTRSMPPAVGAGEDS